MYSLRERANYFADVLVLTKHYVRPKADTGEMPEACTGVGRIITVNVFECMALGWDT